MNARHAIGTALVLGALLALNGCAALMGNADYRYNSHDPATGRDVTVKIASARELPEGGKLEISPDGKLKVEAGALNADQSANGAIFGIFERLLERYLPPPAQPAAAPAATPTPH